MHVNILLCYLFVKFHGKLAHHSQDESYQVLAREINTFKLQIDGRDVTEKLSISSFSN